MSSNPAFTGSNSRVTAIQRLSELQLRNPEAPSFHESHRDSHYIVVSGLDYGLSEDVIRVAFSQWGTVKDVDLLRDKDTGSSRGTAFLEYEDQRSTDLAVDNANGMILGSRPVCVDHKRYNVRKNERPQTENIFLETFDQSTDRGDEEPSVNQGLRVPTQRVEVQLGDSVQSTRSRDREASSIYNSKFTFSLPDFELDPSLDGSGSAFRTGFECDARCVLITVSVWHDQNFKLRCLGILSLCLADVLARPDFCLLPQTLPLRSPQPSATEPGALTGGSVRLAVSVSSYAAYAGCAGHGTPMRSPPKFGHLDLEDYAFNHYSMTSALPVETRALLAILHATDCESEVSQILAHHNGTLVDVDRSLFSTLKDQGASLLIEIPSFYPRVDSYIRLKITLNDGRSGVHIFALSDSSFDNSMSQTASQSASQSDTQSGSQLDSLTAPFYLQARAVSIACDCYKALSSTRSSRAIDTFWEQPAAQSKLRRLLSQGLYETSQAARSAVLPIRQLIRQVSDQVSETEMPALSSFRSLFSLENEVTANPDLNAHSEALSSPSEDLEGPLETQGTEILVSEDRGNGDDESSQNDGHEDIKSRESTEKEYKDGGNKVKRSLIGVDPFCLPENPKKCHLCTLDLSLWQEPLLDRSRSGGRRPSALGGLAANVGGDSGDGAGRSGNAVDWGRTSCCRIGPALFPPKRRVLQLFASIQEYLFALPEVVRDGTFQLVLRYCNVELVLDCVEDVRRPTPPLLIESVVSPHLDTQEFIPASDSDFDSGPGTGRPSLSSFAPAPLLLITRVNGCVRRVESKPLVLLFPSLYGAGRRGSRSHSSPVDADSNDDSLHATHFCWFHLIDPGEPVVVTTIDAKNTAKAQSEGKGKGKGKESDEGAGKSEMEETDSISAPPTCLLLLHGSFDLIHEPCSQLTTAIHNEANGSFSSGPPHDRLLEIELVQMMDLKSPLSPILGMPGISRTLEFKSLMPSTRLSVLVSKDAMAHTSFVPDTWNPQYRERLRLVLDRADSTAIPCSKPLPPAFISVQRQADNAVLDSIRFADKGQTQDGKSGDTTTVDISPLTGGEGSAVLLPSTSSVTILAHKIQREKPALRPSLKTAQSPRKSRETSRRNQIQPAPLRSVTRGLKEVRRTIAGALELLTPASSARGFVAHSFSRLELRDIPLVSPGSAKPRLQWHSTQDNVWILSRTMYITGAEGEREMKNIQRPRSNTSQRQAGQIYVRDTSLYRLQLEVLEINLLMIDILQFSSQKARSFRSSKLPSKLVLQASYGTSLTDPTKPFWRAERLIEAFKLRDSLHAYIVPVDDLGFGLRERRGAIDVRLPLSNDVLENAYLELRVYAIANESEKVGNGEVEQRAVPVSTEGYEEELLAIVMIPLIAKCGPSVDGKLTAGLEKEKLAQFFRPRMIGFDSNCPVDKGSPIHAIQNPTQGRRDILLADDSRRADSGEFQEAAYSRVQAFMGAQTAGTNEWEMLAAVGRESRSRSVKEPHLQWESQTQSARKACSTARRGQDAGAKTAALVEQLIDTLKDDQPTGRILKSDFEDSLLDFRECLPYQTAHLLAPCPGDHPVSVGHAKFNLQLTPVTGKFRGPNALVSAQSTQTTVATDKRSELILRVTFLDGVLLADAATAKCVNAAKVEVLNPLMPSSSPARGVEEPIEVSKDVTTLQLVDDQGGAPRSSALYNEAKSNEARASQPSVLSKKFNENENRLIFGDSIEMNVTLPEAAYLLLAVSSAADGVVVGEKKRALSRLNLGNLYWSADYQRALRSGLLRPEMTLPLYRAQHCKATSNADPERTTVIQCGWLRVWVELFPLSASQRFPRPPLPQWCLVDTVTHLELRVVVWQGRHLTTARSEEGGNVDNGNDIRSVDGEGADLVADKVMSNLLVSGAWRANDESAQIQKTDVHMRSQDGSGIFGYRMVFNVTHPARFPFLTLQALNRTGLDLLFGDEKVLATASVNLSAQLALTAQMGQAHDCCSRSWVRLRTPLHPSDRKRSSGAGNSGKRSASSAKLNEHSAAWSSRMLGASRARTMPELQLSISIVPKAQAVLSPVGLGRSNPNRDPYLPPVTVNRALIDWAAIESELAVATRRMIKFGSYGLYITAFVGCVALLLTLIVLLK